MDDPGLEDASNAIHILLNHYYDNLVPGLRHLADPDKHLVEVALLARPVPLVEAALTLAERGYGREAMMLNRPLFELLLDAHWAQAHRDLANDRYVAYARFTQHLQRQVFQRFPELGVVGQPSLQPEEVKRSQKVFGEYGGRGWTGVGVKKRVEILKRDLDPEEHRQLDFVFEVLHRFSNAELHPSSRSLARALRRVPTPEGGHRLQFRSGPEPELAAFALGHSWWIFVKQLDLVHGLAGVDTDSLQEAADAGAALLDLVDPGQSGSRVT